MNFRIRKIKALKGTFFTNIVLEEAEEKLYAVQLPSTLVQKLQLEEEQYLRIDVREDTPEEFA